MNPVGAMSSNPRGKAPLAVLNRPTKESRKMERRKVGRLSQLVVQAKTKTRYEESFRKFCEFHHLQREITMLDREKVDLWASAYIEFLWEDGAPKSEASYALAAIQFFHPQTKNHLVWAWKLVKTWNQVELPTRATPLSPEIWEWLAKPLSGNSSGLVGCWLSALVRFCARQSWCS